MRASADIKGYMSALCHAENATATNSGRVYTGCRTGVHFTVAVALAVAVDLDVDLEPALRAVWLKLLILPFLYRRRFNPRIGRLGTVAWF